MAWHDGVIGVTSIASINGGDISNGTVVAVKGELTGRIGDVHTISSVGGGGFLVFVWSGDSPALGSIIVVRGTVESVLYLKDVTSVQVAWLFK